MYTSSTLSSSAVAPKLARSDLIGARRIERLPKDMERAIGEEIAPRIRHGLPVLDDRRHHDGIMQHRKATGPIRLSEVADPRNDDGRRRSDRGKLRSSTETDYARRLNFERHHTAVLSRYDHLHAYGRGSSVKKISGPHPGGVYCRHLDETDLAIPQQEGDTAAAVSSSPAERHARPEPARASLTTGRQSSSSHAKMLLGTSSDKTVYQRPNGRGKRARDEKRKSRSGMETRTRQQTVSASCFSAFGQQQQNGAERQTEDLDLMTFHDGALVGGFDAATLTSSTREIPGFPSNQVPQDQKLLGRGVTRYGMQDRWNSFISANAETGMDVEYRFEDTDDRDNTEKERDSNAFAEMQSVHEENASDSQSLISDHEDQRQADDGNRSESMEVGAFVRSSNHDRSSSNARLMRKDTFSGLNDLFDDSAIETNSMKRKRAIRSQGGSQCRRISSFKFLMPRTEEEEEDVEKETQAEKVTSGGMSRYDLQRSFSDGAMTYPETTPGLIRPPVPAGFVTSLAANASDSGETVANSSCTSKTELLDFSNHSPTLIPYEKSLHASYAEPFAAAAATALDPIHNIPTAGYANVFELKVPILCPTLRRSTDAADGFITEFTENARSQNNSLPDGRHFDSIRGRFPTYLTSGPIVVGFQMKDRDVSPHGFRDPFGRNFLDDRCLDEDRSIQSTADAFCRIPRTEKSATTMSSALLSRRPQPNDGHGQSSRSLPPHRFIPTYVNQQQTELDGPWNIDGYPATAEDDEDDYWQSDYTDPCLCLHGDLMRGNVEHWEASDAQAYDGRLRRRSRTQRRLKTEKRSPGRSTFRMAKSLENSRQVEEIFRNVDGPGRNNQAPPRGGESSYPIAVNGTRLQSNREIVPLMEGGRLSGVDIAARSTQERNFDGARLLCPGIEIATSEDERRSMINHQRTIGNATSHANPSTRNVEGAGHAQTPRGERAAGESNGATQTRIGAEEHERKLEQRMRMLGVQQAFCLMLVIGAYIFLSVIYFKQQ